MAFGLSAGAATMIGLVLIGVLERTTAKSSGTQPAPKGGGGGGGGGGGTTNPFPTPSSSDDFDGSVFTDKGVSNVGNQPVSAPRDGDPAGTVARVVDPASGRSVPVNEDGVALGYVDNPGGVVSGEHGVHKPGQGTSNVGEEFASGVGGASSRSGRFNPFARAAGGRGRINPFARAA